MSATTDTGAALPRPKIDFAPALAPFLIALIAAPLIGSTSTFITLTFASLAMGLMLFTMASGFTLVFGLMDVLNFGHGAFISIGAYMATLVFATLLIQPVYGQHLKQILVTTGGLIVVEQLLYALFGPDTIPLGLPTSLRGAFHIGDAAIEKFRLLAVVVGLVIFVGLTLTLNYTKIGLLIRAGVENREM